MKTVNFVVWTEFTNPTCEIPESWMLEKVLILKMILEDIISSNFGDTVIPISDMGFKAIVVSLVCLLRHLRMTDSWGSPLVWHLPTSWRPAQLQAALTQFIYRS